jgi:16S rRNA (uracil1498-N3)-methyltransferase
MHRLLVSPTAVQGDTIVIRDAATLHHACRVLRLKTGGSLECFDGAGRTYAGRIAQCSARELRLTIDRRAEEPASRPLITVALAMIQPQRFEWFLQKATELDASRLVPMLTARTTIRAAPAGLGARRGRWQRIVASAAAQCGRATLPTIEAPRSVAEMLQEARGSFILMPTCGEAGASFREALAGLSEADRAAILIGPEGDFTPDEVAAAKRAGARTVRLGRLTLRSETAALAALAVLQSVAGRW